MTKKAQEVITNAAFVLLLAYGILQIYAGFIGLDFHLGTIWTLVILVAALAFRFPPLISIGAYFGATDVWGWHWVFAVLFAVSGLVFLIPALILPTIETIKR